MSFLEMLDIINNETPEDGRRTHRVRQQLPRRHLWLVAAPSSTAAPTGRSPPRPCANSTCTTSATATRSSSSRSARERIPDDQRPRDRPFRTRPHHPGRRVCLGPDRPGPRCQRDPGPRSTSPNRHFVPPPASGAARAWRLPERVRQPVHRRRRLPSSPACPRAIPNVRNAPRSWSAKWTKKASAVARDTTNAKPLPQGNHGRGYHHHEPRIRTGDGPRKRVRTGAKGGGFSVLGGIMRGYYREAA